MLEESFTRVRQAALVPVAAAIAWLAVEVPVAAQNILKLGCQPTDSDFNIQVLVEINSLPESGGCYNAIDAQFWLKWADPTPGIPGEFIVRGTLAPPCNPCDWGISTAVTEFQFGQIIPVCPPIGVPIQNFIDRNFNNMTVEKVGFQTSAACTSDDM